MKDVWSFLTDGQLAVLPRLGLAIVLSAAIGWEREARNRPAGLRTHMLVGLAAALLVALGDVIVERYRVESGAFAPSAQVDPLRIMEAIVSGVSFIAAGTIFVSGQKNRIEGLTTAASLLATTIVALATGLGLFFLAIVTTVTLLVILRLLSRVERAIRARSEGNPFGEVQRPNGNGNGNVDK